MGETPQARVVLHQVATHVLARRRYEVTGRFGLRASPAGVATPAFGPEPEVLRTAGGLLIREVGGTASSVTMAGASLRQLAAFAGTDVDRPFSAGADSPALVDADAALDFDEARLLLLAGWFSLGWQVLDRVVGALGTQEGVSTIQLWPEHFDAATTVSVGQDRVNLGFSPGDAWLDEPYAYVGPWGEQRPGSPSYWSAPFGAALSGSGLPSGREADTCQTFFLEGIRRLASDKE